MVTLADYIRKAAAAKLLDLTPVPVMPQPGVTIESPEQLAALPLGQHVEDYEKDIWRKTAESGDDEWTLVMSSDPDDLSRANLGSSQKIFDKWSPLKTTTKRFRYDEEGE